MFENASQIRDSGDPKQSRAVFSEEGETREGPSPGLRVEVEITVSYNLRFISYWPNVRWTGSERLANEKQ